MKKILFLFFIADSLLPTRDCFSQGPWTQRANMPGLARHRIFAFSIGSRGYIGCGWNGVDMYADFWEYDPGSNSWTQKADYPPGPRLSSFGFSIGNKGYAGSGLDQFLVSMSDFYEYNPSNNSWTQKSNFGGSPRFGCATAVINNKGYVAFGDEWDPSYWRTNDMWVYDPAFDSWNYETSWPVDGRRDPSGFALNNKFYVGLGSDNSYIENGDWWEYDPASGFWTQKAFFGGSPRSQATPFAVGGKGYVGLGGQFDEQDYFEYNAATNSWRGINIFPGAGRENSFSFVIGNYGYVTCGTNGINYNDLWQFDPQFVTGLDDDHSRKFATSIFPNPMHDRATLELSPSLYAMPDLAFELYDLQGQKVSGMKIISKKCEIQRNDLKAGTYFFSIISSGKKISSGKLSVE